MSKVSIEPCTCNHPAQDKLYGKGMRVWNWSGKFKVGALRSCTVCGKQRGSKS